MSLPSFYNTLLLKVWSEGQWHDFHHRGAEQCREQMPRPYTTPSETELAFYWHTQGIHMDMKVWETLVCIQREQRSIIAICHVPFSSITLCFNLLLTNHGHILQVSVSLSAIVLLCVWWQSYYKISVLSGSVLQDGREDLLRSCMCAAWWSAWLNKYMLVCEWQKSYSFNGKLGT